MTHVGNNTQMSTLISLVEKLQRELNSSLIFSSLNSFPLIPFFNLESRIFWFNSYYSHENSKLNLVGIDCFFDEEGEPYQISNKLYLSRDEFKKIRRERKNTIRMLKAQNELPKSTFQATTNETIVKSSLLFILKFQSGKLPFSIKWIKKLVKEMVLFGEIFCVENFLFVLLEGRASRVFKLREKLVKSIDNSLIKVNHINEIPKLSMKGFKVKKFENLYDAREHLLREYFINLSSYNF
jgi:hypothetical protein